MKEITDRIEKSIHLAASRSRVWRALTDSGEFGRWFGIELAGPWRVGERMRGRYLFSFDQPTVDEWMEELGLPSMPVAETLPEVFCIVEAIEPEERFAFRWIPFPIDAGLDPETEPKTLVEFFLTEESDGILLKVVESGFDRVPMARRKRAFLMNTDGWESQLGKLSKYLAENADR